MANKEEFKTRAVIKKVRLSYCNLLEPTAFGNEEPRYRTDIIIPKADIKNIEAVKLAINEAIRKAQQTGKPLAGKDLKKAKATGKWHSALKDGDVERPEDEAYKNSYFLSAWKAQDDGQPDIIDLTNKYITKDTPNASDRIYSGCYVTISVSFFGYEKVETWERDVMSAMFLPLKEAKNLVERLTLSPSSPMTLKKPKKKHPCPMITV